jgi:protein involved in polysaccharide export with SLBB domain
MRGGRLLVLVLAVASLAGLAGCSSPSGGKLTLFPEGHHLIEPARVLREISSPPPGVPRELDKCVAGPYTVEPGDVLLIQPGSLDSPVRLPGDQPILPDGTIQLGRFGRLNVAGKPVEAIELEVNAHIKAQVPESGPLLVRLVIRDSKLFYVLGEVNAPGSFPLKGRETVLDAIVAAGGLNCNASRRIILVRPTSPESCRLVLPVHYNAIVQLGDTTTNYQIKAGDRVYVPSKSMWEDIKACFDKSKDCTPLPMPCHLNPAATLAPPVVVAPKPGEPGGLFLGAVSMGRPKPIGESAAPPPPASVERPIPVGVWLPPLEPAPTGSSGPNLP